MMGESVPLSQRVATLQALFCAPPKANVRRRPSRPRRGSSLRCAARAPPDPRRRARAPQASLTPLTEAAFRVLPRPKQNAPCLPSRMPAGTPAPGRAAVA